MRLAPFPAADAACRPCVARVQVETLQGGSRTKSAASVYYAKAMRKLATDAGFVGKEAARLKKMLDDSGLSDKKRCALAVSVVGRGGWAVG